jgi:hypothetical protein
MPNDPFWESAAAEEAFFQKIRSEASATRTFLRPSRSGGVTHVVTLDASNTPVSVEHPCSCRAGAEGRFCWASLEILQENGNPQVAAAAAALAESRKPVTKGRRNQE